MVGVNGGNLHELDPSAVDSKLAFDAIRTGDFIPFQAPYL